MGILRKVVRQKKQEENEENYWSLYRIYAHLPHHMQPYEFIKLKAERERKGLLELRNFLKELLNEKQDDGKI